MQNNQLELVKEQEEEKQRQLGQNFEKAVSFVQNERKQLLQLQGYESDYLEKIQQEQHTWTADNSIRYRHFCLQLSQTIEAQKGKLTTAEQQLDGMRQALSQQQQRINVLDDLIEKDKLETAHIHDKLVQKEMDDLSARQYYR
ncbi:MAG: flagellar export protein FliJ [Cellvibrionaceae bacterium]